ELMEGNPTRCFNSFRMHKDVLLRLVHDLESLYGLQSSCNMNPLEMVATFLHIVGQGCSVRNAMERFQYSSETVSRIFGEVLESVCRMGSLDQTYDPEFKDVPPQILSNSRYMPHFKDCIGVIDGVHVPVCISPLEAIPYIGRRGIPTQNVMAICDFDMQFTFCWASWEGSAHDTRIFYAALRDPMLNYPHPPNGKYYLVDSRYPPRKGYISPYKGER
ncbi:LOW QUALITY PROTEIN: DDE_4 domain-containing protein, partial [Cephalotus follicularis]